MAIALQVGWHGPNNSASSSTARSSPAQSSHCLNGGGGGRKRPWSEDSEEMLQLMMGQFETRKETLDLLGVSSSSSLISSSSSAPLELLDLETDKPLPCGWEKCLDLKTGAVYYMNSISGAKTLNDPRESTLIPSSTTKASSTDLINERPARALFRTKKDPSANQRDDLNLSSLAYNNLFGKQSSMGTIPQHMATRFHLNSKPKCEEELSLEGVKPSPASDSCKVSIVLSEKTATNEAILDSGLELNLNLSTFKSAAIEEKPFNLNDYRMVERRVGQKVSLLSESKSSSHSSLSLQTRDGHSVAAAVNGINHDTESNKAEGNHHYTANYSSSNNMMIIVGCPRCLMYVMLWKSEPKCPKCGSFVINADSPYLSLP